MTRLPSIKQPLPLAKIAYKALRNSILTGKLIQGEIYNEMSLAKDLGISRTPVREALLELSSQGLISFLPRKGLIVNYPTKRDIEEIFELRKAIEIMAVEIVANASPPCDLNKIEQSIKDQRRALKNKDFMAYMESDRVFHTTLSELTRNSRIVAIMENIRDMIHLIGYKVLGLEGRGDEVIAEHQRVLDAVKKGDEKAARKAMNEHLEQTIKAVEKAEIRPIRTESTKRKP